LTVALYCNWT